eukprot:9725981-Alexandrium_andersonii.AAC.1
MEFERAKDEPLGQFVSRRDQEVMQLARYPLALPSEAQGLFLEEGAQLGRNASVSLRALTAARCRRRRFATPCAVWTSRESPSRRARTRPTSRRTPRSTSRT